MLYCASRTVLRMRLTVDVCRVLCCVRLLTQHNTQDTPTARRILSGVRLTQYDMLPQHQVNIRNYSVSVFNVKNCTYMLSSGEYCKLRYDTIHLVVCLTTSPKPLPKRALHIMRSRASSFKCEYPFLSLRSSSSFLRFLPRLPDTSIPPFIFPSITRCRRQFLLKM